MRKVVTEFRRTLPRGEKFKPQDVLLAFNSFMRLMGKSAQNASIANLFCQQTTRSYTCSGCAERVQGRTESDNYSLMTNGDIQEELDVMQNGRHVADVPTKEEDKCPYCGGLHVRTQFVCFDRPPKCLVVFRNSDRLLRSVQDRVVVSGAAQYRLDSFVLNVSAIHYYCVFRDDGSWYTASYLSVSPISHPSLRAYTSSLRVQTIPYAFFYSL
jgi:DNA-directed RNA polymerase subunit RPC12/RpoP